MSKKPVTPKVAVFRITPSTGTKKRQAFYSYRYVTPTMEKDKEAIETLKHAVLASYKNRVRKLNQTPTTQAVATNLGKFASTEGTEKNLERIQVELVGFYKGTSEAFGIAVSKDSGAVIELGRVFKNSPVKTSTGYFVLNSIIRVQ